MQIVLWGINYWPEVAGIAPFNQGLCRFLAARGHRVTMVTSFAYYPAWRKAVGDRHRLFRTDVVEHIPVHRCWHYVPARATALRRILHEFSFGMVSFLRVLSLPRADLYIVVSPPLLLGPLANLACWLKRSQYVFHVQDLQPDAALALGMIKADGILTQALHGLAAQAYRHASLVSGISQAMMKAFAEKGVPVHKQYLFPNWVELGQAEIQNAQPQEPAGATWQPRIRAGRDGEREQRAAAAIAVAEVVEDGVGQPSAQNGVGPAELNRWRARYDIPQDAFVASYSGNLGRKQGLEVLIDAAEILSKEHRQGSRLIIILIVGDGAMRPVLEARLRNHPLPNARLLPLLPEADYRGMIAASDICLITQAKGTGQFCLPSKLLSILAAGKPVAAAADETSELTQAFRQGNFGVVVPPEEPGAIAGALADIAARPAELARLGLRGSQWVTRFEAKIVLGQFERRLQELVCPVPTKCETA
jgi:colanic acid biosynthesis glycosyl transferase WcaI